MLKNNLCMVCFHFNRQLRLIPRGTNPGSLDKWLVKELYSFHPVFLVQTQMHSSRSQITTRSYALHPAAVCSQEYHVPWTEKQEAHWIFILCQQCNYLFVF